MSQYVRKGCNVLKEAADYVMESLSIFQVVYEELQVMYLNLNFILRSFFDARIV